MSFRDELIAPAGRGADTTTGRAGGQNFATSASNVNNPSAPNPPALPVPTAAAAAAVAPAAAASIGMQKLLDTMKSLGMSTAGLNISYSENTVGYPGGSYVNRMINVSSGGRTEQFSAELTEKNPFVTAYEMQRYLGVPAYAGGANGIITRG